MTEPHCVHLLEAERELLADEHRSQLYRAVCGEELPVSELPGSECEPGCERDVVHCLACLRTANERNYEAGADIDCPPGVIVRTDR